jgi:hypothetical protein
LNAFFKPAASLAIALVASTAAMAADPITVGSLLAQGYTVSAAIPSQIGPGLFLQKGPSLFACFVSEKAGSPDLTTAYCKPVH